MYFKVNRWLRNGYKANIWLELAQEVSPVLFEKFHHLICELWCRNSTEKFAMVICTYSVHITMEDFRDRNIVI